LVAAIFLVVAIGRNGLTVAPVTVASSFTALAFLALLRVLIKLFFWMDTVDSPRSNFFFRPTSSYVAWRVPNFVGPVLLPKIAKNNRISACFEIGAPAAPRQKFTKG
jgi:hypothetical protein